MLWNQKNIYICGLASCLILYFFSFLGSLYPIANLIIFFALILAALIASLYDLRLGALIMAMELILNGKGYLFALPISGAQLSLRIALWGLILTVWLWRFLFNNGHKRFLSQLRQPDNRPLIALAIFVIWGVLLGFLSGNGFANIFFDANNWLYWLAILPALYNLKEFRPAKPLLLAAISALSIITVWLLYAFSHDFGGANLAAYAWVRDSGLGEITLMPAGYYRVFLQSQIYFLPLFFGVFIWLLAKKISTVRAIALGTASLCPIIISLSRSFWFGLIISWLAFIFVSRKYLKFNWRSLAKTTGLMIIGGFLSLLILFVAVKFPWPNPQTDISASLLTDRASALTGEAGASSRWALLPELTKKIMQNPILGKGFGTTVTYHSSDPRILEFNASGEYTTYSFEWGWLDIWLKMGIGGLIAYLWLLLDIGKKLLVIHSYLTFALLIGIISIITVNIFTPYLNHPLGIGLIIFTYLIIRQEDTLAKI